MEDVKIPPSLLKDVHATLRSLELTALAGKSYPLGWMLVQQVDSVQSLIGYLTQLGTVIRTKA
jgi:hypothetical protein